MLSCTKHVHVHVHAAVCRMVFVSLFAGNAKLVSLSGAVKLAAVSNIQIPGTVIMMIRKYCKVRGGEGRERGREGSEGRECTYTCMYKYTCIYMYTFLISLPSLSVKCV